MTIKTHNTATFINKMHVLEFYSETRLIVHMKKFLTFLIDEKSLVNNTQIFHIYVLKADGRDRARGESQYIFNVNELFNLLTFDMVFEAAIFNPLCNTSQKSCVILRRIAVLFSFLLVT